MANAILVLCDERDLEIGAAMRAEIVQRGQDATLETCDAAEESLGLRARDSLALARTVIVVVREGGRGNRLLHAAEDEAHRGTAVLPLVADASPDYGVSERTRVRIETLGKSLGLRGGPPPAEARSRGPRSRLLALAVGLFVLAAIVGPLLWMRGCGAPPGGPPVVLTGMLSNAGWMVQFHLREQASVLEYKLPSDPAFVSTGDMGPTDGPDRDKPHARLFATLTDVHGKVPIQVRYRTMTGASRGPYEVVFDPAVAAVTEVKKILDIVPEWISFRLFAGRRLCYFSTLLSYKYALRSIQYGIDTGSPNRNVRFTPRDTPGIDNDDELYIDLSPDASSVTVEITYLDGATQKKRFPVRY